LVRDYTGSVILFDPVRQLADPVISRVLMLLNQLQLSNFRNYSQKEFTFSPAFTVVVGPNTSGKTSLLEALMLIATGRSFRAQREEEMIRKGEEVARTRAELSDNQQSTINNQQIDVLEVVLTAGTVLGKKAPYKKLLLNKISKRYADFVGRMPAVLFWPEDLRLITGRPSRRRHYLDSVLSQVDHSYRRAMTAYEKALRIRNKLLHMRREGMAIKADEFDYWTAALIAHGATIHRARSDYLSFVNTVSLDHGDAPNFHVVYDHSTITPERLEQYHDAETATGVTLVGPHRDDIIAEKSVKNDERWRLDSFGSRGEQRLGVLWLKRAELLFIEEKLSTKPLLLLDDIFSELDAEHRSLVIDLTKGQQTVITTTDNQFLRSSKIANSLIHKL